MKKLIPVLLLGFAACTQEPVSVVLKGGDFFGRSGAASPRIAMQGKGRDSYISFHEEPAAMPAKVGGVGVSDLPPLTAAPLKPESNLQAAPMRLASTVTGSSVSSKPSALGKNQPVPVMSSAIKVESPSSLSEVDEGWYQGKVVATKAPVASSGIASAELPGFMWPVRGKVISHFGPKANGLHNDGINIAAEAGSPVNAAADGVVVYAGNALKGYGNMVIVRHDNGWMTAYAHTDRMLVNLNTKVKQGQQIATVGKTGTVDKTQLHFGLRQGKSPVDPMRYLSADFASVH